MGDIFTNNPLRDYFLKAKSENDLNTRKDIADYFSISFSVVNNALNRKTLNPSRKVIECLSDNLNRSPEQILTDIYSCSFTKSCNHYVKTVAFSLYYNFGYTIYFDSRNFIEGGKLKIPSSNQNIPYFAKMRITGPELKYTLVLDWCNISKGFSKAFMDSNFVSNTMDLINPFYDSFYFSIISGLFAVLKLKSMADIKRVFIVFPTDEAVHYKCIRELLYDYQGGITPLLYDENAEYSIRDVDI